MPATAKTYRLYFNYRSTAPVVWAIDEGSQDSEIHVQRIEVEPGVALHSCFSPVKVEGAPSAWFELTAHCRIEGGIAHFTAREATAVSSLREPLQMPAAAHAA